MDIRLAHDAYKRLTSIHVDDTDFFAGEMLARALRSPRHRLADNLVAQGALSRTTRAELHAVWKTMAAIRPEANAGTLTFDNIYELLLWVYDQTAAHENAADPALCTKLVFRGHESSQYKLETTAQRRLRTSEQRAGNQGKRTIEGRE
jgi:hypothetical protein